MGHINEPNGVTPVVEKPRYKRKMEQEIKDFIKKTKTKNKKFLESLKAIAE